MSRTKDRIDELERLVNALREDVNDLQERLRAVEKSNEPEQHLIDFNKLDVEPMNVITPASLRLTENP